MAPHDDSPASPSPRRSRRLGPPVAAALSVPLLAAGLVAGPADAGAPESAPAGSPSTRTFELGEVRSLDGSGNNTARPEQGAADSIYPRETPARYADGIGEPVDGPPERAISNRIFDDGHQNVFSENGVTHWGFVWGQLVDHTIGLRLEGDDDMTLAFDPDDPLESFTNDLGAMSSTRSAAAEGTGQSTPREQVNRVSSYLDGWAVYGGTDERLDWLRDGPVDGDPTNNDATLVDDEGYLPRAATRPGAEAPTMDLMGRLIGAADDAVVAGDVRANENIGLTAAHTLLLREHNRIVAALPGDLDEETRFQIARRVVSAIQQHITYTEFLPAMGIELAPSNGYDPGVDASVTNEFATVGYRAHSMVHGELEAELDDADEATLDALEAQGVEVTRNDDGVEVAVPLNVAFGNPSLLPVIGLGEVATGLASEAAYRNDEQIDNQLRSVLFQLPSPDAADPSACLDGEDLPDCFTGVTDLGALDVARTRDHGMPSYSELRAAYGLAPATSFTDITGKGTEDLPDGLDADDPEIMDFVRLVGADGTEVDPDSEAAESSVVRAERRTTTAARLAAVFGDVDEVDAFTGMLAEPHLPGVEMGELQHAMWVRQFTALRDGDRFFYEFDPLLDEIEQRYGIDHRRSLADLIVDNTDVARDEISATPFLIDDAVATDPDASPTHDDTAPANPEPDADAPRAPDRRIDGTRDEAPGADGAPTGSRPRPAPPGPARATTSRPEAPEPPPRPRPAPPEGGRSDSGQVAPRLARRYLPRTPAGTGAQLSATR